MLLKMLTAAFVMLIAAGQIPMPSMADGQSAAVSSMQRGVLARLQAVKRDIAAARAHNP